MSTSAEPSPTARPETAGTASPAATRRPGLRERKKARTREAIRTAAMQLFREQGYTATTVEQIAEAAEVSPSTFFRYFPTKDALVVSDEYDPLLIESFRAQPAELGALAAFRAAYAETFRDLSDEQMREQEERTALILSHPELRAAFVDGLAQATDLLTEIVAERTGRDKLDLEVLGLAGALIGAATAVLVASRELSAREQLDAFALVLDRLGTGFDL